MINTDENYFHNYLISLESDVIIQNF